LLPYCLSSPGLLSYCSSSQSVKRGVERSCPCASSPRSLISLPPPRTRDCSGWMFSATLPPPKTRRGVLKRSPLRRRSEVRSRFCGVRCTACCLICRSSSSSRATRAFFWASSFLALVCAPTSLRLQGFLLLREIRQGAGVPRARGARRRRRGGGSRGVLAPGVQQETEPGDRASGVVSCSTNVMALEKLYCSRSILFLTLMISE